jgi:hypothetical protein
MHFDLVITPEAQEALDQLPIADRSKHLKVLKTLGLMQTNLRSRGLHTHEYVSLKGPHGEKVFEAYVENNTPAAYRVFWYYGPAQGSITILTVTPHP